MSMNERVVTMEKKNGIRPADVRPGYDGDGKSKFIDTYFLFFIDPEGREKTQCSWSGPQVEQPPIPEGMVLVGDDDDDLSAACRFFVKDTRPESQKLISHWTLEAGCFRHLGHLMRGADPDFAAHPRDPLDEFDANDFSGHREVRELANLGLGSGKGLLGDWQPLRGCETGAFVEQQQKFIAAARADHAERMATSFEQFEGRCLSGSIRFTNAAHREHLWQFRYVSYRAYAADHPTWSDEKINFTLERERDAQKLAEWNSGASLGKFPTIARLQEDSSDIGGRS